MKVKILLIVLVSVILAACTIQRRQHLPGVSIQWKKNYKKPDKVDANQKKLRASYVADSLGLENENTALSSIEGTPDQPGIQFEEANMEVADSRQSSQPNSSHFNKERLARENRSGKIPAPEGAIHSVKKIAVEKKNQNGDNLLYLSSVLMALATIGAYRLNRKKLKKVTRWAQKNPKKAQWFIAGMQIPLMGISLYAGYNLEKMGYVISETPGYVFGAAMLLGFLSVPFLPKQNKFQLPKQVTKSRLAFLGISLSSVMLLSGVGNNIGKNHPDSTVSIALESIDKALFSAPVNTFTSGSSITQSQITEYENEQQYNSRAAGNAGLCTLAVLLILLLILTTCAGVCMIVLSGGGIALILGGIAVAGLSIWGIFAVAFSGWCRFD